MTRDDNPELELYLLGRLEPEAAGALELRLLRDPRLFELAEAAEDDLVDRYARGELAAEDARRFERRLLPSERIAERVRVAKALAVQADDPARPRTSRPARARPEVAALRRPAARWAWAAALIATLAAGALALEVARLHHRIDGSGELGRPHPESSPAERPGRSAPPPLPGPPETSETSAAGPAAPDPRVEELERELAAARETILALEEERTARAGLPADRPLATATVFLALATRSRGGGESLVLGDAERVSIELELGRRRPEGAVDAEISREEIPVWRARGVEIVTEAGESIARLSLPRESLTPGRYRVVATEREEGGPRLLGGYELLVEP